MAVIQISRIQVRRGVADLSTPSGLPQLASGEIGWALDQQRLWIGSGSVEEGAPAVENVEIVTVPSLTNILATFTASNYTYKLDRSLNGDPLHPIGAVGRTIQSKLDDVVNIKDFGGADDSDITVALQKAIDALYITTSSIVNGPVLNLNPTNYNLTATVYLPPNAKLQGVPGKTSITMLSTSTTVFQTVGVSSTGTKVFDTQIVGTVDNVQVHGISFLYPTTSTFTTTSVAPTIVLDKVHNSEISDCVFSGVYDLGNTVAADVATGISIRYNNDAKTDNTNIRIKNNQFTKLTHGIMTIDGISNVKISNNSFTNIDQGIRLAKGNFTGLSPYAISINENYFEKIYHEAIYVDAVGTTTNVISEGNIFRMDVGAGLSNNTGDLTYVSPVIKFKSVECTSINDNFGRFEYVQPTPSPQDGIGSDLTTANILPLVEGNHTFQTRQPIVVNIAQDPNVAGNSRPLVVVPISTNSNVVVEIDYILNSANNVRTGKIDINYSTLLGVALKDDYRVQGIPDNQSTGDYLPTFTAVQTNNSIVVYYGGLSALTNYSATVILNVKATIS